MNTRKLLGLLALFGAALLGGGVLPSLIREGSLIFHPFIFNWFRSFFGFLMIAPFISVSALRKQIKGKNWGFYLGLLGLGLTLNMTLFAFAIHHTTLVASQLIYTLVPLFVSVLAFFLLGERLNQQKLFGMLIALVGVALLIVFSQSPEERRSLGTLYGNLLITMGALGYSTYLIFSKKFSQKLSLWELVFLTNASLSIFQLPLLVIGLSQSTPTSFQWSGLWMLVLIAVVGLAFTFCVQLAIQKLSANTASLSSLITPQFAALTGIVMYGERVTALLIISMTLTITGVLMSVAGERQNAREKVVFLVQRFQHYLRRYV